MFVITENNVERPVCMDTEEPVRPYYEWQKGDVNARSSAN